MSDFMFHIEGEPTPWPNPTHSSALPKRAQRKMAKGARHFMVGVRVQPVEDELGSLGTLIAKLTKRPLERDVRPEDKAIVIYWEYYGKDIGIALDRSFYKTRRLVKKTGVDIEGYMADVIEVFDAP